MMRRILCGGLCALSLSAVFGKPPSVPTAPAPESTIAPSATLDEPGRRKVSGAAQKLANRALEAFKKNDLAGAETDFLKVLELAPENPAALINLGLIHYRRKNPEEAVKWLKRATHSAPDAGLGWLLLGIVQFEQEKLDAALAALAQAVVLEPRDARPHFYLGVTVGRKGWYSGAEEELRKALELDPTYADAHYNLAVFYLQRVPPALELARRHYQKARDLGAAPDAELEKTFAAQ